MTALNAIIIGILAFKTWACFFDPATIFGAANSYEPAHTKALLELAGRNIAMIAVGGFVLVRPSVAGYTLVFLMGLFRESADMIFAANFSSFVKAAPFLIFLILYTIALWCLRRKPIAEA